MAILKRLSWKDSLEILAGATKTSFDDGSHEDFEPGFMERIDGITLLSVEDVIPYQSLYLVTVISRDQGRRCV